MNFSKLIADFVHDQWLNFRRALDEKQAREELLAGACLYFFEPGTTNPVNSYADSDFAIPHCHPVIASSFGEFPPIWLDRTKPTSLRLDSSSNKPLLAADDALAFCVYELTLEPIFEP